MTIKFLWFRIFGLGFALNRVTIWYRTKVFDDTMQHLLDIRIYLLVLYISTSIPLSKPIPYKGKRSLTQ